MPVFLVKESALISLIDWPNFSPFNQIAAEDNEAHSKYMGDDCIPDGTGGQLFLDFSDSR